MASLREELASLSSAITSLQDPSSSDLAALNNEIVVLMGTITDALAAFETTKGATKDVVERIATSGHKLTSIAVSLGAAINALPSDIPPPEAAPVEPPEPTQLPAEPVSEPHPDNTLPAPEPTPTAEAKPSPEDDDPGAGTTRSRRYP
jgi:hypothetical protein